MTTHTADPSRRQFILTLGASASLAGLGGCATTALPRPQANVVPHSAGTRIPRFAMPALACDSHHHIYDRRYAAHPSATLLPDDAALLDHLPDWAPTASLREKILVSNPAVLYGF